MDDGMIANAGMGVANKSLEVMDDIIQALLAALKGRDTDNQKEVLKDFSEHIKSGGSLSMCNIDPGKLEAFQAAAKEQGLTYYAVMDDESGKVSVLTKDCDAPKIRDVAVAMDAAGTPLYDDPQLTLADFVNKYGDNGLAFSPVKSYGQIEMAKNNAAEAGLNFAVAKRNDNSLMAIYRMDDVQKVYETGVAAQDAPVKFLTAHTGLMDVRSVVKQKKESAAKEKEQEKEKKRGR